MVRKSAAPFVSSGTASKEMNYFPFVPIALAIAVSAITFSRPFGDEGMIAFGDLAYVAFAALAFVLGILATRKHGLHSPLGKFLLLLTITLGLDALAGVIWMHYELALGVLSPFPSWADLPWVLYYIAGALALLGPLRRLWSRISTTNKIIAMVVWLVLTLTVYRSILQPIFADQESTLGLKALSAMYPLGSLVLLGLAALLFTTLRSGVFGKAWFIFVLAFTTYAIGDLAYTYTEWAGTYASGQWTDVMYFFAQLLFAYGFYKHITALNPEGQQP